MVQGRGRLRFPVKAFQSAGVFSQIFWKKLQSDETAERSVFGLVHHAHPATAELLDDAVMGDGLADQWRGFHPRDAMLGVVRRRSQRTFGVLRIEGILLHPLGWGNDGAGGAWAWVRAARCSILTEYGHG